MLYLAWALRAGTRIILTSANCYPRMYSYHTYLGYIYFKYLKFIFVWFIVSGFWISLNGKLLKSFAFLIFKNSSKIRHTIHKYLRRSIFFFVWTHKSSVLLWGSRQMKPRSRSCVKNQTRESKAKYFSNLFQTCFCTTSMQKMSEMFISWHNDGLSF